MVSGGWLQQLEQADQLKVVISGYELRPTQLEMARFLDKSIDQGHIALVEAPTGTGKTLVYLLAALAWALEHSGRVVIGTHTLPLQEQILRRDLPLACKLLGVDVSSSMLKGMNNYLCLQKAHGWSVSAQLDDSLANERQDVRHWVQNAKHGQRSEGPRLSNEIWSELSAGEDCSRNKCPHYNDCFYFRHRKQALQAQVLVVNHHLLASEMKRKLEGGPSLLGNWDLLIIDEAHHLVDVMTRQLALTLSENSIAQLLSRLWVGPRQKVSSRGWLASLRQRLDSHFSLNDTQSNALQQLWLELVQGVDSQWHAMSELSQAMSLMALSASAGSLVLDPQWMDGSQGNGRELIGSLQRYSAKAEHLSYLFEMLVQLLKDLGQRGSSTASICSQEAQVHLRLLHYHSNDLKQLMVAYDPKSQVAWVEWDVQSRWQLQLAKFDLAACLRENLLESSRSVIMCSATLGGCQDFEPLYSELGLSAIGRLSTLALPSSFDWQRQSLLLVCEDLPLPSHASYMQEAIEVLRQTLVQCAGRCLILTTSMHMLRQFAKGLSDLPDRKLLVQATSSREQLLKQFAEDENSILLGADSFWEGIDLAGQPISMVVITKLPFDVPTEPLMQAKAQALYGKQLFHSFVLPRAVLRFQQGVGRLLRHSGDRGCVICLDSRLCKARYARRFLKILSPAQWQKTNRLDLADNVSKFLGSNDLDVDS